MLRELAIVVGIVEELPVEYQRQAAIQLGWLVKRAEEEMTMTNGEIAQLRELESVRARKTVEELIEVMRRRER